MVLKATGGKSESCTLFVAAKADGDWKGEGEEEKEEEIPMAAAVTASRPCRKAPPRVVDWMGAIDLLLAVAGVVGVARGVVLVVLMLLQLGKEEEDEEAASTLSSDEAADRACEAVNLELLAVLCRWRRSPKAAAGDGK